MKRPAPTIARLLTAAAIIYWAGLFAITHLPPGAWLRSLWGADHLAYCASYWRWLNEVVVMGEADKLAHCAAYAGLTLLVAIGVWLRCRLTLKTLLWIGAALACYGVIDELIQYPIPGRSSDPYDWLADLTGIALMLLLIRLAQWGVGRWLRDRETETASWQAKLSLAEGRTLQGDSRR